MSEEEPKKVPGWKNPEVQKKAQEASLATRRRKKIQNVMDFFEPKEEEINIPACITEKDVNELAKITPGFIPSVQQLKILAIALSLQHGSSVRGWFKVAGEERNLWYGWLKNPDFTTWWNKAFQKGIEQYRTEWLSIGLRKMHMDFDYWKTVGEKVFGFIQQIGVKETKTEDEEQLTKELLELVTDVNRERKTKIVDGIVVDVAEVEKLENELKEIEDKNGTK